MRALLAIAVLLLANAAMAQQVCLTTSGGHNIVSDPFPLSGTQPTSCSVYKGGSVLATGLVVLSNTVASTNAGLCLPPSATYIPGPAGSVACQVQIPAQPAGNVTVTMTASAGGVESAQSAPFTFVSAAAFSPPPVPTNLRLNP